MTRRVNAFTFRPGSYRTFDTRYGNGIGEGCADGADNNCGVVCSGAGFADGKGIITIVPFLYDSGEGHGNGAMAFRDSTSIGTGYFYDSKELL